MATTTTEREQAIQASLATLIGKDEAQKALKTENAIDHENSEWI